MFYSVLSDDVHSKSPLENPKYIKFFNGDLRDAVEHFVLSRDII